MKIIQVIICIIILDLHHFEPL